jgi:hypothetical protein
LVSVNQATILTHKWTKAQSFLKLFCVLPSWWVNFIP